MSLKVMAAVWQSDLPSDEKFVAVSLADWADDDGFRIYPSQDYLAWKVGKTSRAVRDTLKKLQERGVLVAVGRHYAQSGGHGGTVEYRLVIEALPERAEWVSPHRAEETSDRLHPEVYDTPVGSLEQPGRKPTSYDPLSDPLVDPSERYIPRERFELPSGTPTLPEPERLRMVAMQRALFARLGISVETWFGHDLIRRGLTESDVEYAITRSVGKGSAYVEKVMRGRVEEREAGNDPDASRGGGARGAGGEGGRGRGAGAARGGGDYRGQGRPGGLRGGAPGSDGRPDANTGWRGFATGGSPAPEAGGAAAGA